MYLPHVISKILVVSVAKNYFLFSFTKKKNGFLKISLILEAMLRFAYNIFLIGIIVFIQNIEQSRMYGAA